MWFSVASGAGGSLDVLFHALADPTRRALLARLRQGDATVSQLAAPARLTLTGLRKHLRVLEQAGLVRTRKQGRSRRARLLPGSLAPAADFVAPYLGVSPDAEGTPATAVPYVDLSDMDVT